MIESAGRFWQMINNFFVVFDIKENDKGLLFFSRLQLSGAWWNWRKKNEKKPAWLPTTFTHSKYSIQFFKESNRKWNVFMGGIGVAHFHLQFLSGTARTHIVSAKKKDTCRPNLETPRFHSSLDSIHHCREKDFHPIPVCRPTEWDEI